MTICSSVMLIPPWLIRKVKRLRSGAWKSPAMRNPSAVAPSVSTT